MRCLMRFFHVLVFDLLHFYLLDTEAVHVNDALGRYTNWVRDVMTDGRGTTGARASCRAHSARLLARATPRP